MEALRKAIEKLKGSTAYLYDVGKDNTFGDARKRTIDGLLTLLQQAEEEQAKFVDSMNGWLAKDQEVLREKEREIEYEKGRSDDAIKELTTLQAAVREWLPVVEREADSKAMHGVAAEMREV